MTARKHPLADRPSIFRRTEDGAPELSDQQDAQTPKPSNIQTSKPPDIQASEQLASPRRVKRTFYLPPEDVLLLDELQLAERRRTGRKPELSTLVSEAIRLLQEQRPLDS